MTAPFKSLFVLLGSLLAISSCAHSPMHAPVTLEKPQSCVPMYRFGFADPESEDLSLPKLIKLTQWVEKNHLPIFSITISRRGKIIYELYTSGIQRDEAHYLMSVSKSVTSALFGVALDHGLVQNTDESVSQALPRSVFPDDSTYLKFSKISLKDTLSMSALDAPLAPHVNTQAAKDRLREFFNSSNRFAFALKQDLLPHPGTDFQYTDVTPLLIAGVLEYATGQTLFDFAKAVLFDPMDFKNAEWMHEDRAGFDNAAYGLRLRPIDMQKFGILFLNEGCWEGNQLISPSWIRTSFTPWIRSKPTNPDPDYGWYWWKDWFAAGWVGHIADGWQGQRIALFPEQSVVVTMTGAIKDGSEGQVVAKIMNQFVIPALGPALGPALEEPASQDVSIEKLRAELKLSLARVLNGESRFPKDLEPRLTPSAAEKERHWPFSN